MFETKSILAIIPARAGSKGVKKKNIRLLANKPLVTWSIVEALKSKYIDKVVITTNDEELIRIVNSFNVDIIKRPDYLAQDITPMVPVIMNVLEKYSNYDYILLLQPTSPLRDVIDIDSAIETAMNRNLESLVSVSEISKHPFWMYHLDSNQKLVPFMPKTDLNLQRQQLPKLFNLNGSIYFIKTSSFISHQSFLIENTYGFITEYEKSIDIDSELDFLLAEAILLKKGK